MHTTHHRRGLYAPELLESRIAPATFTVTSLADDGSGATLRDAIDLANLTAGADTITFAPALLPGTITLGAAGEIVISDTLTIKGPGIDKLTIDAHNASRIFRIDDGNSNVLHPTAISGLTLFDGNAESGNVETEAGGAILSRESLSLKNMVIHSSQTGDTGSGGGVFVFTSGKVSFNRVQLLDNSTLYSGGGAYILARAGVSVVKSLFSGNDATGNRGGGLVARTANAGATIVVDGTSFVSNTADGDGGALFLEHGDSGNMTLKNSILTGNTAGDDGGAVFTSYGKLAIGGTSFSRNKATGGNGGAIAERSADGLKIAGSRFDGNTSGAAGGALYTTGTVGALYAPNPHPVSITGSLFTGNGSTARGGAIHAAGGNVLTVKTSTFAGNGATTNGGAISLADTGTSLVLASSTVSGNAAVDGGGIFADSGAKLTVTGGVFAGNSASVDGGGIRTTGSGANAVALSVTGTLFQGNGAGRFGGAAESVGDGTVLIKGARVLGNHAVSGGGMDLRSSVSVTVLGSLFRHNVSDDGGGLTIVLSGTALGAITGSKFLDNFATADDGGGIFAGIAAGTVLTIKGSLISGNVAVSEGGGLFKTGAGTVNLLATVITGNWAPVGPNMFP